MALKFWFRKVDSHFTKLSTFSECVFEGFVGCDSEAVHTDCHVWHLEPNLLVRFFSWTQIILESNLKMQPNLDFRLLNPTIKTFTILLQFYSNFQEMTHPRSSQSLKVWGKLIKNCRFFISWVQKSKV